ncbi:hypothetical protein HXX76_004955 [Chlamydomonas incerta]|uniref:Uncharacterized protein n=1 Tax=Chlamydomonas incerta TaxID=51695 RepID=A0A835W6Y0_CHLIN|nr:hypothetical protein HXX76_004955 [Chlamydomonas incerta]|eukprot:KAG2439603.1 hypothetical protein HXX76_004955 [Chlamydomonas incerta]
MGFEDRFTAVEIETPGRPSAFDANQYSFFGELTAADTGLEGALEDGLEAPPDEDGLQFGLQVGEDEGVALEQEEDYSVAAMFRNQLGLAPATKTPARKVDPDEDAGMDALLTDPLAEARKQLRDEDYDHREENLPAELFPTPASYGLYEGYAAALGNLNNGDAAAHEQQQQQQQQQQQLQAQALLQQQQQQQQHSAVPVPPPSNAGSSLLSMIKKPKAMTLEELEARMLSSAAEAEAANQQQQQSRGPMAPPPPHHHQQHQQLMGPPGMPPPPPGMGPMGQQQQQQQRMPPPPPHMPGFFPHGQPPHMAPPPPPPGHPHLHGPGGPMGPPPPGMPPHMHGMPPPPPGPPGMYPPGPMGHMAPGPNGPPHPGMFGPNGMPMPPPGHPLHPGHGHGHGPMMPGGPMGQGPYGPGGPMQRGPYGPGPVGPGFMHEGGFPMRPMGSGPPGPLGNAPLNGAPQRPGMPFGPGGQPGPRPGMPAPPMQPGGVGAMAPRPAGLLGPGAAALRPPVQARPAASNGPDFGRGFSPAGGAAGMMIAGVAAPIALAAAAAAAGRAGGAATGPGGRLGGVWMRPEDVEYVVRSMLYSVANGVPYVEDYYYQAFVHKHVSQPTRQQLSPGAFPMAAPFVPEALRELSEDAMAHIARLDPSARAKFVEGLTGLGKIVLSNIRTPKVLMDLSDSAAPGAGGKAKEADGGEAGAKAPTRPLEQEPLLAARIMIEDVMNLLLDVDDIDRLATHMAALAQAQQRAAAAAALDRGVATSAVAAAAAAGGAPSVAPYGPTSAAPPAPPQLRQRRELLLAGINGAFRLPNAPAGAAAATAAGATADAVGADGVALGDGVLLRIMALSKGRTVVARALLASAPPASLKPPSARAPGAKAPAAGKAAAEAPKPAAEEKEAADAAAADGKEVAEGAAAAAATDDAAAAAAAHASALGPDGPSPYVLLWAVLRNAWQLFGSSLQGLDPAAERPMLEATSRLAAALRDALLRLPSPRDVVDAAVAFNAGAAAHVEALGRSSPGAGPMETTMLPLAQTRAVEAPAGGAAGVSGAPSAWLGEALAALVTRASQLGLAAAAGVSEGAGGAGEPAAAAVLVAPGGEGADVDGAWVREYGQLHERVARHLGTLGGIHAMATSSNNAEALAVVRALCCRLLVNAMLPHASTEQARKLKEALQAFAA